MADPRTPKSTCQEAGVFHGSELSAFVEGPQMQRTSGAFALLRADGGVVTWGRACPRDGLGDRGVVAQAWLFETTGFPRENYTGMC